MSTASSQSNITVIDSEASLLPLLDSIARLAVEPPSLYIDLEGIALGRHGSISILSLHIAPTEKTYLIDIHNLGAAAFLITTKSGTSLKSVLESPTIPKVIFDIRNDSDALFGLFNISVDGIKDLQLMELATRTGSKRLLWGLAKCIERDSPISGTAKTQWSLSKDRGHRLFAPEKGGRYRVFNERPLRPEIALYCMQDVALLPGLYTVYSSKLRGPGQAFWRVRIRHFTKDRVKQSQSPGYDGNSRSLALGWDQEEIDRDSEDWNDDIMMETQLGMYVLNEHDEWVSNPTDEHDFPDEDELDEEQYDDDWYQDTDTARDCIGWEEDMIKNGEYF